VVMAGHRPHELDGAAGRPERERPERVALRPVFQGLERGRDPAFSEHLVHLWIAPLPGRESTSCDWQSQAPLLCNPAPPSGHSPATARETPARRAHSAICVLTNVGVLIFYLSSLEDPGVQGCSEDLRLIFNACSFRQHMGLPWFPQLPIVWISEIREKRTRT